MSKTHELPVLKYLSMCGLLKMAMTDKKQKPNVLYYPVSPLTLYPQDFIVELEKDFDCTFEHIGVCTDDLSTAK
jgi:hypothetical protein